MHVLRTCTCGGAVAVSAIVAPGWINLRKGIIIEGWWEEGEQGEGKEWSDRRERENENEKCNMRAMQEGRVDKRVIRDKRMTIFCLSSFGTWRLNPADFDWLILSRIIKMRVVLFCVRDNTYECFSGTLIGTFSGVFFVFRYVETVFISHFISLRIRKKAGLKL